MDQLGELASGAPPVSPAVVLGAVVGGLSLCHVVVPSLVDEAFALVPHHTVFTPVPSIPIPFLWNVGTAHLFEASFVKAVVVTPLVFVLAQLLERLWSAKAIALHVVFTVTCSGALFFFFELIHVARTHHEKDFFIPVSGCCGLLVALAVGVRHAYPLEPIPGIPRSVGLQYQHLAFTLTAITIAIGLLMPQQFTEWWFAPWALFFGWFHLRYLMWFPHVQAHGDHSEEFTFAAVFPRPLRPFVSCVGALAHSLGMLVAPGFVSLRVADAELGQAQSIVYDPTTAAFGDDNVTWTPNKGALPDGPGAKEHNDRRMKALAFLDQNINSLLAPEGSAKPAARPLAEGVELSSLTSRLADLSTLQSLGGERQQANGEPPRGLTPLRPRGPGSLSTGASPDRGAPASPPLPAQGGSPPSEDQKDRDD